MICTWDEASHHAEKLRASNKIIVSTNGCFDLLHPGHLQYLKEAKSLGDALFIGLNSDQSVQKLKGPQRPINNEHDRALMLSALKSVDFVCTFEEDTPCEWLKKIRPHIHVKGGDYKNPDELPESQVLKTWEGSLKLLTFLEGYSSTNLIQKIKNT